jgi:hypothetical protein
MKALSLIKSPFLVSFSFASLLAVGSAFAIRPAADPADIAAVGAPKRAPKAAAPPQTAPSMAWSMTATTIPSVALKALMKV